jgi:outer membrane receptor protein involved in Fe transport
VILTATGLADGSTVVNGATSRDASEFHSASAIEGWYVEQSLALNERAYLTAAVRGDASSSFGNNAKDVYYPKWSASWLLSQEPFFPRIPGVNNLRLRAAFGHAGVQPSVDARFRSFKSTDGYLDNGSVSGLVVSTVGNPSLRPERSTELEGGFDLSLWQDRATIELTTYKKITRDALITRGLPPSLGLPSRQENIGRIDNRGFEILSTLRPIESQLLNWSTTINVAHDRNRLVSLGPTTLPPVPNYVGAGQGRYVEGYPVNGFWDRPILGYADVDGDGIIESNEIRLGDSAVYRGQPYPKATASVYNNLSFFSGWVSLGVGLDFTYGITQLNGALWGQCNLNRCQWATDANTSLLDQAYVVATRGIELSGSTWGFLETGSFARLSELSMTFTLPQRFVSRFRSQGATISIMGRNLKLWSDYHGADPEVNTNDFENQMLDEGGVPQPREWSVRLNLRY